MTIIRLRLSSQERQARLTLLCELGEKLYGPLWHAPMAQRLGVRPRTIRRWRCLQWDITDDVMQQLRAISALD